MADNQDRRDRPGGEGGGEPDQTRAFDPLAGDKSAGPGPRRPGPDDTAPFTPGGGPDDTAPFTPGGGPDDTAPFTPGGGPDDTAPFTPGGGHGDTAAYPPGAPVPADRTAAMPAADQTAQSPAWSGRASVPPPVPPVREGVPAEWGPGDQPPGRTWWLPILIGLVALILLAVLGVGLWLIASSRNEEAPTAPSPSPTTVPSPTSLAPTTDSPSPSPTTADSVAVPPVVGLPQPAAEALLDQAGLRYRVEYREEPDRPAGTVLEADPEPGEEVEPDTEVTLIVAEAPEEPPTSAPATEPGEASPTGEPSPSD